MHGPGCPVCVTSLEMIDRAHAIASRPDVIFCSFGDMLRVPGSRGDLLQLKSQGSDVRVVYSPLDAVNLAAANPDRKVVFFAIGFETTAPPNAMAVWLARKRKLTNFSVLVSHVLVPPAMTAILESPGNRVQGFLGPGPRLHGDGHAPSTSRSPAATACRSSITGFEPLDLLEGVLLDASGSSRRAGPRSRTRTPAPSGREGNPASRRLIEDVFEVCDRKWRGRRPDPAERLPAPRTSIATTTPSGSSRSTTSRRRNRRVCISGQILKGLKKPHDCPAFGSECTPQTPLGATMVSSEGACAAYYAYGRHLEASRRADAGRGAAIACHRDRRRTSGR